MADTIQELYGSFAQQMEPIQAEDRYFRYLFELAQASDTQLQQKREVLHKVVDEAWISVVEDSLDSINTIIEHPRRFVTREEELVPVELARKINGDSVRHLSQHTEFIQPSDDGGIHPSKVLNVSTQETYDLYENRFIFHLIKRLLTFVDKRTDAIFWSTGDEVRNRFLMQTKIGDAYEDIEYKVEMTIKNRQSFAENDADNQEVFMRLDRLRRLVSSLRSSSFCQIMEGCAKVKSPIQRTNLIMKDPDYRKCYKLWQFMESYDEVGYAIEIQDTDMAVDDEYIIQMYTNLVNNYTVFKTLTQDQRNMRTVEVNKLEMKKPKYVKEIVEEYVDDCNIPDVEIRQVFVDEVTKKQMAAEAALAEETKAREAAEQATREAEHETVLVKNDLEDMRRQYYAARDMAEKNERRASRAEGAQEDAEEAIKKLNQRLVDAQVAVDNAEMARDAAETSAAEVKANAEQAVAQATAEAEATRAACEARVAQVTSEAQQTVESTQAHADATVAAVRKEAAQAISDARAENEAAMAGVKTAADLAVTAAEERTAKQAAASDAAAQFGIAEAQSRADAAIAEIQERSAAEIAEAKRNADAQVAAAKEQAAAEVAAARQAADAQIAEARANAASQIADAREQAAKEVAAARDNAADEVASAKKQAAAEVAEAQAQADAKVAEAQKSAAATAQEANEDAARAKAQADATVSAAQKDAEGLVLQANERADKARRDADSAAETARKEIDQVHAETNGAVSAARAEYAAQLEAARDEANKAQMAADKQIEDLKRELAKTKRELARAQKKAESTGLFGRRSGK